MGDRETHVDHCLDRVEASSFRAAEARAKAMMQRKSNDTRPLRRKTSSRPTQRVVADSLGFIPDEDETFEMEPVSRPVPVQAPTPVQAPVADNVVTIEDDNVPFEIAYPFETKVMAIGMNAVSVDVSEDSVSILIRNDVHIKLPKLEPLRLTVREHPYKVCWAGGTHTFGKFKHISFVVVE